MHVYTCIYKRDYLGLLNSPAKIHTMQLSDSLVDLEMLFMASVLKRE